MFDSDSCRPFPCCCRLSIMSQAQILNPSVPRTTHTSVLICRICIRLHPDVLFCTPLLTSSFSTKLSLPTPYRVISLFSQRHNAAAHLLPAFQVWFLTPAGLWCSDPLQKNSTHCSPVLTWTEDRCSCWCVCICIMTKSDCQSLTFLVQTLLLIQDNQFTVLVSLLQHLLTLVNVAVVVLQTKEGGHQRHVGLQGSRGEERGGERSTGWKRADNTWPSSVFNLHLCIRPFQRSLLPLCSLVCFLF